MIKHIIQIWQLRRAVVVGVLLVTAAGCSNTNLGNIDETDDPRETMPGPGVLANEQGESPLTLKTGADKEAAKSTQTVVPQTVAPVTDEKAEFEQFKKWDHLRTNAPESAEYQEFLEWIKYQKFKAGQ
jgi:hypothetical protein